jgi:hypothetical protein
MRSRVPFLDPQVSFAYCPLLLAHWLLQDEVVCNHSGYFHRLITQFGR